MYIFWFCVCKSTNGTSVFENIVHVLCNGENSGEVSLNISGGTPPYTQDWNGFNNLSLTAGNYIYDVIDSNNCITSSIVSISQPSPISVFTNIIQPTCPTSLDGQVNISVTGGVAPYQENWGGINTQALSAGTYNFLVIDSNNCIDSNEVIIESVSNITVNSIISDLDKSLSSEHDIAPQVYLLNDLKLIDFSGLT